MVELPFFDFVDSGAHSRKQMQKGYCPLNSHVVS
jgi:hypothetical protein